MSQHYDVVIIGTGAGGGTLAYRLASSGKRILLLERGGYVRREKANWDVREVVVNARYHTRDIGGNYADLGRAMGGHAERVEKPEEIVPALQRARKATEAGKTVLLEFMTSQELAFSHRRAL